VLVQEGLSPETIAIVETAESPADIITQMSEKLAHVLDFDHQTIERAVLARERTRTTAFTNGAAIPHCRLAGLKEFGIGLMVLQQAIRWDNEGHTVDTIMMIAGPTENVSEHLRILANSSQLLDCSILRSRLKQAPNSESAHRLISAVEQAIEQRRSQHGMLRELLKDQQNGTDTNYLAEIVSKFEW